MKKEWKKYLSKAYEPPKPQGKDEFLYSLNYPKTGRYRFFLNQIGYVRKRTWATSFLLFLAVLSLSRLSPYGDLKLLWAVSAIFPFLAMITIIEVVRSAAYGLAELEMTTRYNLRSLIFARMATIGSGNLLLLLITTPMVAGKITLGSFQIGIYLLVPYLITSFLSYVIVNRIRSKDFSYYCAATAAAISFGGLFLGQIWKVIYRQQYFILWFVASIVLSVALYKEMKKLIHQSEDMLWNSYSTV